MILNSKSGSCRNDVVTGMTVTASQSHECTGVLLLGKRSGLFGTYRMHPYLKDLQNSINPAKRDVDISKRCKTTTLKCIVYRYFSPCSLGGKVMGDPCLAVVVKAVSNANRCLSSLHRL